jgi:phosphoribosylaminoimidazole-succinocarboxamide synthase
VITGKGVINNRISEFLMTKLGEIGVPTHFIRRLNMREQLIRQVEIIPLEVVVRNVAAGSFAKRFGVEGGHPAAPLDHRVLLQERRAGRPDGHRGAHHRVRLGDAAGPRRHRWRWPSRERLPVRPVPRLGIKLIDFKIEFGRLYERRHGADRAGRRDQPGQSCRLWDLKTNEKMDKDRFRRDLGKVEEAYQEVARRLGILPDRPGTGRRAVGPTTLQ